MEKKSTCDFCDKKAKYFVTGYVAAVFEIRDDDELELKSVIYPYSHLDGEYYCEDCYNIDIANIDHDDVKRV